MRLKFDDFFCDEVDVDRHPLGFANWDNPSSIKWEWLQTALATLKTGLPVIIPNYERSLNKMVGTKCIQPTPIILLDGYQVLYDPGVRDYLDFALYFDLPEDLQIDRRIARQPNVDRGYLYHVMIPAARAFLYPTKKYATHMVNATLEPDAVYQSARSHFVSLFDTIEGVRSQTTSVITR